MACGLPIVTSNRHGINDYSIPEVTGYKCHPNDYDGFANAIKTLLLDDEKRSKMGEHNKTFAQEFSLSASLARMKEIYGEFL